MNSDWRRYSERGTLFHVWLIRTIALRLGRGPSRLLLYPITLYFLCTAHDQRRASRHYLRRVLGREPNWWDIARHFHCFAATILDRVFFLTGRFDLFELSFTGLEVLRPYLDTRRGCLLVGAHLGSFDALRAAAVQFGEVPLRVLMYPEHNAVITRMLAELNPLVAAAVIPLGGIDSLLHVHEALESGEMVGLLGDRMGGNDKSVSCELLGTMVDLPAGPAMLAATTGAPVVLCLALYRGGKSYDIHFEALSSLADLPRAARAEAVCVWTRDYARWLETQIRRAPFNWFNFYDYWGDA